MCPWQEGVTKTSFELLWGSWNRPLLLERLKVMQKIYLLAHVQADIHIEVNSAMNMLFHVFFSDLNRMLYGWWLSKQTSAETTIWTKCFMETNNKHMRTNLTIIWSSVLPQTFSSHQVADRIIKQLAITNNTVCFPLNFHGILTIMTASLWDNILENQCSFFLLMPPFPLARVLSIRASKCGCFARARMLIAANEARASCMH